MKPIVAEVLRAVNDFGRIPADYYPQIWPALSLALGDAVSGDLLVMKQDGSMFVTSAGAKALRQANLWLDVAARSGYEAARAVAERKTEGHVTMLPWSELGPKVQADLTRAARDVLAGCPLRGALTPPEYAGYGAEEVFARVVVAAFGEGE